ncbi:MAG: 5,6-dimethylbenzimidazole synthase [Nitrospinae bacterium]|nr:5,6-dimethylbenzimidazole synthase [Nitrospinota bacterium]
MSHEFPEDWRKGVYQAILRRRDIRHFLPDQVPLDKLARILSAAHHAGSVGFMQPWDFILVDDMDLRARVRAHVEEERLAAASAFTNERREQYLSFKLEGIMESPVNICVTCDRERQSGPVLGRNTIRDTDLYSTCAAIQNLWLAARAEGIGVGWVSILKPDKLKNMLNIPRRMEPVAYLCLGYAKEFPVRPMLETSGWLPRVPLASIVHSNSYAAACPEELAGLLNKEPLGGGGQDER